MIPLGAAAPLLLFRAGCDELGAVLWAWTAKREEDGSCDMVCSIIDVIDKLQRPSQN